MRWKSENDGIDHINVYSKGRTSLGRLLSNFSHLPIDTEDGRFASIEGYWYWLGCPEGARREKLRELHGLAAKIKGRELRADDWPYFAGFKEKIKRAITTKIETYPGLKKALLKNRLPLAHYYNYGGKIIDPVEGRWIIRHIESLAEELRRSSKSSVV